MTTIVKRVLLTLFQTAGDGIRGDRMVLSGGHGVSSSPADLACAAEIFLTEGAPVGDPWDAEPTGDSPQMESVRHSGATPGERLAKLERWKGMVQRPTGYLTGLDNRLKALEDWKQSEDERTEGTTQRRRDWLRDIVMAVIVAGLAFAGGWLSRAFGDASPDPPPGS